ncbi:MAG TPA: hypothetical protein VFT22_31840 [Kofleriaceae bacterium]|nr:hypothetical protein [Kofleriaceae bacterium]
MIHLVSAVLAVLAIAACGTQTLRVEPVKVEPIHMTVDINLHDAGSGPVKR